MQAVQFQVHRKMLNEHFCLNIGLGGKLIIPVEGMLHHPHSYMRCSTRNLSFSYLMFLSLVFLRFPGPSLPFLNPLFTCVPFSNQLHVHAGVMSQGAKCNLLVLVQPRYSSHKNVCAVQ